VAVAATRILRESRDPARGRRPDLAGALLLCLGVAALALAIVKGGEWGWAGGRVVATAAVALVALVVLAVRSSRHPAPVVEPALVRAPGSREANAAVLLFSMGFFSLLLVSTLFMTGVWGYSVLQAGLAIAPGPLMVALLSFSAGSLAGRLGPRLPVTLGALAFAAGCAWWVAFAGARSHYATDMLPGVLATGIGVSLIFPVLAGAAVAGLPSERTATGSALFTMARQIGGVLGVAIVVAILGDVPDLASFHEAWVFMGAAAVASGAVTLLTRTVPA
jgi:hypothetical protein